MCGFLYNISHLLPIQLEAPSSNITPGVIKRPTSTSLSTRVAQMTALILTNITCCWVCGFGALLLPFWVELGDHNRSFSQILQLAAQPPPVEIACVIGLRILHRCTQLALDTDALYGMLRGWPLQSHRDFVFVGGAHGVGGAGGSRLLHQVRGGRGGGVYDVM